MIDFDLEMQRVHPINLKEIELNHYRIDDNAKKAIILYNAAIGYVKKGNFDLTINDLKKALSYNKDFTEAIKLMGLSYVAMKEYRKAEKTFKRLDKYVIYNELVNEYMQSLGIKKSMPENITIAEASKNKRKQTRVAKNSKKRFVISLLIIAIVIVGVSMNYFYPGNIQGVLIKFKTSIQVAQEKFQPNNKIAESNEETDKNSNKDEALDGEKATVTVNEKSEGEQKNVDNTKLEEENYKNTTLGMLSDAEKFLNDGNYEKGASILISVKSRNLDDDAKTKFNRLWESLTPNSLWAIYNEGNKLYKQNKYAEALPKLIIASEIDPNLDLMPWITFQIGMCYKETNDNANALVYFNKVKDNYPKSEYSSNAGMMISQIGN